MARSDCPICGRVVDAEGRPPWRPFCSPRCKKIDLAAWLDGAYRLSRPLDPDEALALPDAERGPERPS